MYLESFIESEVSQKEKNEYSVLTQYMESKKKTKMVLKNLGAGQE